MKRSKKRWQLLIIPVVVAVLLGGVIGVGVASMINMPRVESLSDFTPGQITQLFDRNGRVFATYAREKRILLEEGEVPELLQQAIIAAEDTNFFQHGGVDAEGVARAALNNLNPDRTSRIGGSTITMQLAREIFLTRKKTWRRKVEEALLAVELEKSFSKQQILTLYCNLIFLGHGNYGFEAASQSYFNKSVGDLQLPEAAMLAGIPQRPSDYSAYRRPDLVIQRRDYVLRRMREEEFITPEEYEVATNSPLLVVPQKQDDLLAPYFAEEVRRYLESTFGSQGLLEKGLQVHTTVDPAIQVAAENALRQGLISLDQRKGWRGAPYRIEEEDLADFELPSWTNLHLEPGKWVEGLVLEAGQQSTLVKVGNHQFDLTAEDTKWTGRKRPSALFKKGDVAWFEAQTGEEGSAVDRLVLRQEPKLEGAVVVLESATGAIRAMVGGWDFSRSSFNRATQARRQVGSAFKVFVYGTALEAGFTPADTIFDAPVAFPGANLQLTYSPRNYSRRYYGITTLRRGLEHSFNVAAAKLGDLVGLERVIEFARRCGISSPLQPYPSLSLGAAELVPLELAAAYASIANQGVFVDPFVIERITGPNGSLVEEHQPQVHKAMEPEIAAVLTQMLAGVVDRGTAVSIKGLDVDLAGKTGTTDRYVDAWFVGFTPRWTLLTWVGHDKNKPIGRRMTGAAAALPIWRSIVESGLEEGWIAAGGRFTSPPSVVNLPVEYFTGFLPGTGASAVIQEAFITGTEPSRIYDPEWQRIMSLPWYQQRPFYLAKSGERMPDTVEDWAMIQEAWAED